MKQFSRLLLALSLMATTPVFAQSQNTVYIDQIGSSSNIDVTQTGSNNVVGDETNNTIFRGNSQLVMITQIGSNNNSVFNIQGNGAQLTSNVTGSFNTVNATCGAAPTTACTDTIITANINGNTNIVNIAAGAKSLATVDATGDNNNVGITSSTTKTTKENEEEHTTTLLPHTEYDARAAVHTNQSCIEYNKKMMVLEGIIRLKFLYVYFAGYPNENYSKFLWFFSTS